MRALLLAAALAVATWLLLTPGIDEPLPPVKVDIGTAVTLTRPS